MTDDQSRLLDKVRASSRSVAVYDVSTPAILAASPRALEQLGFVDVELAEVNIVDGARDPNSARTLLTLIRDGQLKDWTVRTWLRTADGRGCWDFATGHAMDIERRRLALVSYPSAIARAFEDARPPLNEHGIDGSEIATLEAFSDDASWSSTTDRLQPGYADEPTKPVAARPAAPATNDRLFDRVAELEGHLRRIVSEVQAAGITAQFVGGAMPPETPGLESLSPRELEIVSRMLRGARVPTIARSLYLSASTVRNHLSRIYKKVGVHSQVQLIEALQGVQDRTPSRAD